MAFSVILLFPGKFEICKRPVTEDLSKGVCAVSVMANKGSFSLQKSLQEKEFPKHAKL